MKYITYLLHTYVVKRRTKVFRLDRALQRKRKVCNVSLTSRFAAPKSDTHIGEFQRSLNFNELWSLYATFIYYRPGSAKLQIYSNFFVVNAFVGRGYAKVE